MPKKISVVILAAGKGTRMFSDRLKVLHNLANKPLVRYSIEAARGLNARRIHLVYGHGADQLRHVLQDEEQLNWVFQETQSGTGHAMQQAMPYFSDNEDILMLYADVPLIRADTLRRLHAAQPRGGIALLTAHLEDPNGYGRILRENGQIIGIVEQKDASPQQQLINEINTGIFIANGADLKRWLSQLTCDNVQNEFYVTDVIKLAHQEGQQINSVQANTFSEIEGVNSCQQLARLERAFQVDCSQALLSAGVTLRDPTRFDLRGTLEHGRDVEIDTNVILEGHVKLGNRVKIGTGCVIKNSLIGDDCEISPYSIIENATLATACTVGPFARLRPGSSLDEKAHVGNFVEMKNASLGCGSKAGHLSYLGDAKIGTKVNIGAGTITCNYDGVNKFETFIGDEVFVGSDTQFIAPVYVAPGSTIASGTTVMKDVNESGLVYNRKEQLQKINWQRPVKKK